MSSPDLPTASAHLFETDLGWLGVGVDDQGRLVRVSFLPAQGERLFGASLARQGFAVAWSAEPCARACVELRQYAAGARQRFELELALCGTEFQRRVWRALGTVPFGKTVSYGELAAAVGVPGGARAVGQAVHHNPAPLVVPCHRVIGAGGTLGGFALGAALKRRLLLHEGIALGD